MKPGKTSFDKSELTTTMRQNKYDPEIELLLNLYHVLRESGEPTYDSSRRLTLEQRVQIVHDISKALSFNSLPIDIEFYELSVLQRHKFAATLLSRGILPIHEYLAGRPGGVQ